MPIKVAIVEDDARFRKSLALMIERAEGFECVGVYPNAEAALEELPKDWPDVVLMDINLPRMSGVECVHQLKAIKADLQVVMLTVYVDSDNVFQSLQAGASGYLIKQTPSTEILNALREVQSGGSPMSSSIARKVVQYFQQQPRVSVPHSASELSPREQEILEEMAKGYRDKETADRLSISLPTVRTYIRRIYEKLHVRSRAEAVAKFMGAGRSQP
jgi:DNA-binding NarL/FixJ family response regulator